MPDAYVRPIAGQRLSMQNHYVNTLHSTKKIKKKKKVERRETLDGDLGVIDGLRSSSRTANTNDSINLINFTLLITVGDFRFKILEMETMRREFEQTQQPRKNACQEFNVTETGHLIRTHPIRPKKRGEI